MKSEEITNAINSLINEDPKEVKSKDDFIYSALQILLSIIKTPFVYLSTILKKEVLKAIKKDLKMLVIIGGVFAALMLFLLVLWFSVSLLIGAYFYDNGYSLFSSVLFSIAFQIACILLVSLIAYIASKQLKSAKVLKKVSKTVQSKIEPFVSEKDLQ